jgi:GTP-binding protein Era
MTEGTGGIAAVVLLGRPNVGKSTLFNSLAGSRMSIVTPKPATTRLVVAAPLPGAGPEIRIWDTPGVMDRPRHRLQLRLNDVVWNAALEADLLVWVVAGLEWSDEEDRLLERARELGKPLGVAVNQIDRIKPRTALLPFLERLADRSSFSFLVPVSARRGENLATLADQIRSFCPAPERIRPAFAARGVGLAWPDQAAELFREQLMMDLTAELPYALHVVCESWLETERRVEVDLRVWVERPGQKGIVIGTGGQRLKVAGSRVRHTLEARVGRPVLLHSRVEVDPDWTLHHPQDPRPTPPVVPSAPESDR